MITLKQRKQAGYFTRMSSEGDGAVPWGAARAAEDAAAGKGAPEEKAGKKKWKEKLGLKGKGKKGKGGDGDAEAAESLDLAGEASNGQGERDQDISKLMEAMSRTV